MQTIKKLRGVAIIGAVALAVFWSWPTSEEQSSPKPVSQTVLSQAQGKEARANQHNAVLPTDDGAPPNPPTTGLRYDLKTRGGRQAYYDDLATQKPDHIWASWDEAISRGDPDELGLIIPAMGYALRREGSQDLYNEMVERLYQSNRSAQERLYVIGALKQAATPEAARLLLEYAQDIELGSDAISDPAADQQTLLRGTQEAIRLASMEFINGSRNWEISPALEDTWLKLGKADALSTRATVSQAIVYLGKPEGVGVLINSVSQDTLPKEAREIALSSIAQLSTNDSVPILGKALNQSTPNSNPHNSELAEALAQGLVSVGSAEAMQEILNYLSSSDGFDKQQLREKITVMIKERNLPDEALKVIKLMKEKKGADPKKKNGSVTPISSKNWETSVTKS